MIAKLPKTLIRRMTALMAVVLAGLLLWFLAALVWLVIAPPRAVLLSPIQALGVPEMPAPRFALFRMPVATAGTGLEGVSLLGTMPATPNHLSRALILIQGEPKMLTVGDMLAETGFRLEAVGLHEVKLGDGVGNVTSLTMMAAGLGEASAANESGRIDNDSLAKYAIAPTALPNTETGETAAMAAQTSLPTVTTALPATDAATAATAPDTSTMLSNMGLAISDGGYQVTDHVPLQLKESLGLQSGDKIISINGQPLGANPAADASLLYDMGAQAQLQILRGGEVVQVNLK